MKIRITRDEIEKELGGFLELWKLDDSGECYEEAEWDEVMVKIPDEPQIDK